MAVALAKSMKELMLMKNLRILESQEMKKQRKVLMMRMRMRNRFNNKLLQIQAQS